MKLFLLFLSSFAAAQTAAIPALPVPIPPRVVPAQTVTFTTPRNGGRVTIIIPAQALAAQTTSTAATAVPVSLGTITLTFSCSGPDLQHLSCKAAQQ